MSVIIRLQNLPWSANALDIRNFFRGLSIPEGGVHIVGGELGDAFIAFSTDEDARQAMMLDGGKLKEIQVKLLLSSRSEMHKVIEAARQSVPLLTLQPVAAPAPAPVLPPAPAPVPAPVVATAPPVLAPFAPALNSNSNGLPGLSIPGIGNPLEIPQPAVIEPPAPIITTPITTPTGPESSNQGQVKDDDKSTKGSKERHRSTSRSRDRDKKERRKDRRDRSRSRDRSRDRRRRDRSRSRDRRERRRDRKDRSRSRDRSPRRSRSDRRSSERKTSPQVTQNNNEQNPSRDKSSSIERPFFANNGKPVRSAAPVVTPAIGMMNNAIGTMNNGPVRHSVADGNRFAPIDPSMMDTYNRLQELGKKRNPNAFQGEQVTNGGPRFRNERGGAARGGGSFRRQTRFDNEHQDCCVAVKNAPNHTSYGDVRRFFPFLIDKHGIKMINDNTGRRTGTIYVRFCESRSKQMALQRMNNELKGAQVIVESLEDAAYEAAVDSFLPYREENDDDAGSGTSLVIIDGEEQRHQPFTVLKLSEMPNFVKEHDIIKMFSDFSLLSIMLNECRNSRTKTAFVQFVKPEDAQLALERKERYVFGRRAATVTPVTDGEYDKEKAEQAMQNVMETADEPQEPEAPRDPRQRRPPKQRQDAGPAPLPGAGAPAGPFFNAPYQAQGYPGPFPSPQFGGFPGPGMGPAGVPPMDPRGGWSPRHGFPRPGGVAPMNAARNLDEEPQDCVLMKGLPPKATDRTIVDFLADTGAVPARIHLMLDQQGLPSGDCFCEFRSTQEARRAASKHGRDLNGCRVTIDLVARSVVEDALEGPKMAEEARPDGGLLGDAPVAPYFEPPHRGGFGPRGAGGPPPFRGRGGFDRGGYEGRGGFDRGRGFRRGFDRGGRGYERGRGRGFPRGRGGFDGGRAPEPPERDDDADPALEDFGSPGCVVAMENVPFRATVDDILTFFGDFDLTQDDIIRRFNERGQPTGDARVAFRTPFDAQRALKTRHLNQIYDRKITLIII